MGPLVLTAAKLLGFAHTLDKPLQTKNLFKSRPFSPVLRARGRRQWQWEFILRRLPIGNEDGKHSSRGRSVRAGSAPNFDRSVVLQDDLVADPKAETGASDLFRGEKGLEDALAGRIHAGSGVGDSKAHAERAGVSPIA